MKAKNQTKKKKTLNVFLVLHFCISSFGIGNKSVIGFHCYQCINQHCAGAAVLHTVVHCAHIRVVMPFLFVGIVFVYKEK